MLFNNKEVYIRAINVPFAVIFASAIILLITTGVEEESALRALLGGYLGLGLGVLFLMVLNMPPNNWIDLFPFVMLIFYI